MSKRSVDETVITNDMLPKSWKCPHCGRQQKFSNEDGEIFLSFMQLIRHCENCGYLHFWKLNLTDDFKRKVVDMVVEMAERAEE